MVGEGAGNALDVLREYAAPDAVGSIPKGVVRFSQSKRAGQAMDVSFAEFGILGRRARAEIKTCGASPPNDSRPDFVWKRHHYPGPGKR